MFQNVLQDIGGIGLYGVISICLFFLVFTSSLIRACLLKKTFLDSMSALPLHDGDNLARRTDGQLYPGSTGYQPVPSGCQPDGTIAVGTKQVVRFTDSAPQHLGRQVADRGGQVARATLAASHAPMKGNLRHE